MSPHESPIPALALSLGGAIPVLGFGTWQMEGARCYDAVRAALEVGYRHIDTATMYENEAEIGRAIADSGVDRDDLFITTKLHPQHAGREHAGHRRQPAQTPHRPRRSVADSLAAEPRRVGTDLAAAARNPRRRVGHRRRRQQLQRRPG